METVLFDF